MFRSTGEDAEQVRGAHGCCAPKRNAGEPKHTHWAGRHRRRRGRREAGRSARCGDARAHAARHWQSQAQAQHVRRDSRARKQGRQQRAGTLWRAHAKAHAAALRQAKSWTGGRRAPLAIGKSKQEAQHRSSSIILGLLSPQWPVCRQRQPAGGRESATGSAMACTRWGNGQAALGRWCVRARACASTRMRSQAQAWERWYQSAAHSNAKGKMSAMGMHHDRRHQCDKIICPGTQFLSDSDTSMYL